MQMKCVIAGRCGWAGRSVAILLSLLCTGSEVRGQTAASSSTETLRVRGVVENALTHSPIARALVTTADQRMALLTDSAGKFEFEVKTPANRGFAGAQQPAGGVLGRNFGASIYLMVRKPGYLSMQGPTLLSLGDVEVLSREVRLKLMPEATIAGRVSATGMEAPTGVTVQLLQRQVQDGLAAWQMRQAIQTDVRGEYRFAELMPGEYKIATQEWVERGGQITPVPGRQSTGYPPVFYPRATSGATASGLHLAGGQTLEANLNLRGAPYYSIVIPVTKAPATGGVNVTVRSEAVESGFSLGFNPQTQQLEGSLPDGLYHLTLLGFGEQRDPGRMPRMSFGAGDLVVNGKPVRGAAISLVPGATIPVAVRQDYTSADPNVTSVGATPGTVFDNPGVGGKSGDLSRGPGNTVIRQRSVEVYLQTPDPGGGLSLSNPPSGSSGDEGLMIENVHPGSYRVTVNPHRGYPSSVTAGGVDLLRQPLLIEAGGASPTIEIVVRDDTATVDGSVSGLRPGPAAGVPDYFSVWAYPLGAEAQPQNVRQAQVSPSGQFTMAGVAPGRYLLLASPIPLWNLEYRNEEAMKPYASKGAVVTLGPGQTVNVALTVFDEDGEAGWTN